MSTIKILDKEFVPYIPENEVEEMISSIADKLNMRYKGSDEVPIFIFVLTGAYAFGSSLLSKLDFDAEIAFTSVSSYSGTTRNKELKCSIELKLDITNREVIILDEIIDSGSTVAFLKDKYLAAGAKSVDIAALIYKSRAKIIDIEIKYYGLDMQDDKFIVGWGLDYNERGRMLRDIYILKH